MTNRYRKQTIFRLAGLLVTILALAACSGNRAMMASPNVYQGNGAPALFDDISPELQSSEMDMLYVTDRIPEANENGEPVYLHGRSHSLAFGSAVVTIRPELAWEELQRVSLEEKRSTRLELELTSVTEQHRFPETPLPVLVKDGDIEIDPAAMQKAIEAADALKSEIRDRLELAARPEVVVFVHGYNNQFEDATITLAELWHFLGREFVPIVYTWPAGRGGPTGYSYDRESGEFTIFHLKNFLGLLGEMPEIEKVHLIAHSRGTDVLMTAVRELLIATNASGKDALEEHRIDNLILAAPDLDMDVVSQRLIAEYVGTNVGEMTVYTSQRDKAIGFAERLMKSTGRIGRLAVEDISPESRELLKNIQGISFVEVKDPGDKTGHGYFHSSPEGSSDLIMTMRYGMKPGAENGRPMKQLAPIFWLIEPGYPGPMIE